MGIVDVYLERLASTDDGFYVKLRETVDFIVACLEQYGFSKVSLAFNGGKDCTVLLHLMLSAMTKCCIPECHGKLCVFYVKPKNSFIEMDDFVCQCEQSYNLDLCRYDDSMKTSLAKFQLDRPQCQFVFMGSRSTDPGHQEANRIGSTDNNWPTFILLKPMLKWSYKDVWRFLRDLNIPYCSLYDKGYTSVGSKDSSLPNPCLLMKYDVGGQPVYKPAYLLDDVSKERRGRDQ